MDDPMCSIPDCGRATFSRGWCQRHYGRWLRYGDPLAGRISPGRPTEERLWPRIDYDGPVATHHPDLGACWIWQGKRSGGYAVIAVGGRSLKVYRVVYELLIGPIPPGLELDHFACDGGPLGCVNPWHVRPVTHRENLLRGDTIAARAAAVTHCPHGHPYDEANTYVRPVTGKRLCRACATARREARRVRVP